MSDSDLTIPREVPLGVDADRREELLAARGIVIDSGLEDNPWYYDRDTDAFVQVTDIAPNGTAQIRVHTKPDTYAPITSLGAGQPHQPIEVEKRTTNLEVLASKLEQGIAIPVQETAVTDADHIVQAFARHELSELRIAVDWAEPFEPVADAKRLVDIVAALFFASATGGDDSDDPDNDAKGDTEQTSPFESGAGGNGDTATEDPDNEAPEQDRDPPGCARVRPAGQFDELLIDCVPDGTVAIDYGETIPRLVVELDSLDQVSRHEADDARQQLVVRLASDNDGDE